MLTHLQPYRDDIAALTPLTQAISIQLHGWRDSLDGLQLWNEAEVELERLNLIENDAVSLSRQCLIDWVDRGLPISIRFLLEMLWGNGSENATAFEKVGAMLCHQSIDDILASAVESIDANDIKKAFSSLKKIPQLGVSFLTKALYFETRARRDNGYRLIFDNRVSKALVALAVADEDRWITESVVAQRGNTWKGYDQYCTRMQTLATDLNVDPEQLEYWLFLNNGEDLPQT